MTQWYINELSKLTQVSVQTLHYYDRIGLIKPSVRLANGYRLYSEKDLSKLQQIIALKFFGFKLSHIKTLLSTDVDVIDHFSVQSQFLEQKAKNLFEASQALKNIISDCSRDKSIPWETIIKLIEVYRMTQQLEKTWAGKVLTAEEIREYAHFEQELKSRFTDTEKRNYEQRWDDLVKQVDANLDKDPTGDFGIDMGKRCMDWVNAYYGKNHVALRNAIWEKGFIKGQIDEENTRSLKSFAWLDKAITAYYSGRVLNILSQVETEPQEVVLKQWETLLTDMYGDEPFPKNEMLNALLNDDKISQSSKRWVKEYIQGSQHAK